MAMARPRRMQNIQVRLSPFVSEALSMRSTSRPTLAACDSLSYTYNDANVTHGEFHQLQASPRTIRVELSPLSAVSYGRM